MTTTAPEAVVNHRYDFVLLFDVLDGNPNGDPDAGNMPRIDPQSLQGLVTDGCLKRKIRNAVAVLGEGKPGYDLYFQTQDAVYEKRVLNRLHQSAWDALKLKPAAQEETKDEDKPETESGGKKGRGKTKASGIDARGEFDKVRQARQWMCRQFYDIRAFGAVMTTGVNCGQVRGPVQITFARSVDPIVPLDIAITRKSVTKEEDAAGQVAKDGSITGTMGRKNTVPYALYRCHGFVNPYLARDTGFTAADLEVLWQVLKGAMWEIDRSSSRGLMATRGLYVFEHESLLGNAPAHELFDRVAVRPFRDDPEAPAPRQFADYKPRITMNDALPHGVTLHRMVG
jgi:CRISPR-associated protein Csd2